MPIASQFVLVKLDTNETVGLILSQVRWISYQFGGAERVAVVHYGDTGRTFKLRDQAAIDELTGAMEMHYAATVIVESDSGKRCPGKEPYNA